jgi:hypothetical protein
VVDARITADNLGAWLIKCQPKANPELPRTIREGDPQPVTRWCVADNYRSRMMASGDRVVLWVSGDGRELARGIWGLGWVTGQVPPMVDELGAETGKLEVPLHLPLLSSGLTAETIRAAGISDLEVLRLPQGSNPSWVSVDQLTALGELLGDWPAFSAPT